MKSTFSLSILLIILFIIPSLSAQNLKLEKSPEGQDGPAYQTTIRGLKELKPISDTFLPFYTSFLIYNSGYYQKVEIDTTDHTYPSVTFGPELEGNKARVSALFTSRYIDDEPPERNVIAGDSTEISTFSTSSTEIDRTKDPYKDIDNCISIDTNHSIIFERKNILAISLDRDLGNHGYLFYNRQNTEEINSPKAVENFKSFTPDLLQPHYISEDDIVETSTKSFDQLHNKAFLDGGFNDVIEYRFDQQGFTPPEWRLFVGLNNSGVFESEDYEFLVIQTKKQQQGEEIEICKGNDVNSSRFEEVEQMLGEKMSIDGQAVSAYQFLTLKVEPPTDPNEIWPTSFCSCGSTNEGKQNSLKRYSYAFQFCNESTGSSKNKTSVANKARISFHDIDAIFDCIKPLPATKSRLDSVNDPWIWELDVHLEDLGASGDYSKCCDTIYFYASQTSTNSPKEFPRISACVVFNGLTVDSVCDTFVCSPTDRSCQLDRYGNISCNVLYSSDCAGNRYRCFWQPTAPVPGLVIASLGIIGFVGYIRYRRRKRRISNNI